MTQIKQRVCLTIRPGLEVALRPLRPQDVPLLLDLFEHMSPDSRYNRFHLPLTHPDGEYVAREATKIAIIPPEAGRGWLIVADPEADTPCFPDSLTLSAMTPEGMVVVGGIRYLYALDGMGGRSRDTAEISLVVRDDCQGQGIGTAVLRYVAEEARRAGVRRLVADVLISNTAVFRMLYKLPYLITKKRDNGSVCLTIDLTARIGP